MARKMPTLGPPPKKSPMPKVFVISLLIGGAAGGVFWWKKHRVPWLQFDLTQVRAAVGIKPPAGAPPQIAPVTAEAVAPRPAEPTVSDRLRQSGLKALTATINGPLESAIIEKAGPAVGPALTQVLTRTLVWWVRVPDDVLRGDRISVLYEERANEEPIVHAVVFDSAKTGTTHKAFLYKASSDQWARFYEPDGDELERRLEVAPLDDYEQVTSRLRDGRRHKGVDFKTPEGTPVKATFDGTIVRKNWNFRGNGNCLEIAGPGSRSAMFLHLSPLPSSLRPGMHVHRGEVIAHSGNSGHSFAPHLHYQLMAGPERPIDPFETEHTLRRSLPEAEKAGFDAEMRRFETLMSSTVAGK